jgi:hypothetical protein
MMCIEFNRREMLKMIWFSFAESARDAWEWAKDMGWVYAVDVLAMALIVAMGAACTWGFWGGLVNR